MDLTLLSFLTCKVGDIIPNSWCNVWGRNNLNACKPLALGSSSTVWSTYPSLHSPQCPAQGSTNTQLRNRMNSQHMTYAFRQHRSHYVCCTRCFRIQAHKRRMQRLGLYHRRPEFNMHVTPLLAFSEIWCPVKNDYAAITLIEQEYPVCHFFAEL